MLSFPVRTPCFAIAIMVLLALCNTSAAQALALEDCRISAGPGYPSIKARCGTMMRPENPADPGSPEIEIRVAVVPALNLSPENDPIVPIAGGPGQGSVEFYSSYVGAFEPVRRNRDILLVDQRGTGESSRMDCPIDDDALLFEGEFTLEDTIQFIAECLENLPHDPRYFSTSVAVTDLEAIREALGYSALNLYGVSYGTRVAQHFARRYPDSTRTVVIDGVVPPQVALGPEIATESQKAVDRILARCAEDATCNERFPAVETTFAGIVAALREEPVEVSVPHPSTGRAESISFGEAELAGAVRLLAYSPPTIALLPLFVHEAGKGRRSTWRASPQATWARSSLMRSRPFAPTGPRARSMRNSKYLSLRIFPSCSCLGMQTRLLRRATRSWPPLTWRTRPTSSANTRVTVSSPSVA
jgi:pimeloyl-ACP methyl ester carboxylesterase